MTDKDYGTSFVVLPHEYPSGSGHYIYGIFANPFISHSATQELADRLTQADFKIRELQTQIALQKGINEEQEKKLEEVRLYAKELRFSHQHISYTLRNILKLDGESWT